MTLIFVILIVIAAFILGLIVLIQNPKGGGLSGSFGGFSTQFMGVKQTTDVLEKGTWIFAAVIGILCLFSTFFIDINGAPTGTIDAPANNAVDAKVPATGQPKPGTNNVQFPTAPQSSGPDSPAK